MILGLVAEIQHPDHAPQQADQSEHDERSAPGQPGHQHRDQWRRHGIAEPRERVRQTLGEAPAVRRRPVLHRARCGWKRRALAEAERHARNEQRDEPGDKAGHDGRGRPDQAAPEQRPARTEMVADPAADHLEQEVGIGKGREHQAELGVGEMEFLLDFARRRADVDAVDIGDEVHHAEHRQHDVGGLQPKPHLVHSSQGGPYRYQALSLR